MGRYSSPGVDLGPQNVIFGDYSQMFTPHALLSHAQPIVVAPDAPPSLPSALQPGCALVQMADDGAGRREALARASCIGTSDTLCNLSEILAPLLFLSSGGRVICAAEAGEGLPATPTSRFGRVLAGEALGVK